MKNKKKGPAQQYLERIKKLDTQIDCMVEERNSLKDLALRVTPSTGSGGSSPGCNQDKMGSAISRIVDKDAEIDSAVDELLRLKHEAGTLLSLLDDPGHYRVLHERYIQYKSFEQIAAGMGYTYRNAHYLHGRALQAFAKVLEEHRKERSKTPLE